MNAVKYPLLLKPPPPKLLNTTRSTNCKVVCSRQETKEVVDGLRGRQLEPPTQKVLKYNNKKKK